MLVLVDELFECGWCVGEGDCVFVVVYVVVEFEDGLG